MNNHTTALVVARPGQFRDSLQVLLAAIPRIATVNPVDDGPSALALNTKHHPTLVLLDSNLPNGDLMETLGQIKAVWPGTRCIALVDDEREHQVAKAAGADVVLIKGVLAADILATVDRVLSE